MCYRVLLADDEPIMREALQKLVNWREFKCEVVCIAENGQEVLEFLKNGQADIVITDIKMPGADGIEISKYIYENRLDVKVILLTAYADFSYAQQAITYNVMEYVIKTGAFEELYRALQKCIQEIDENRSVQTYYSIELMRTDERQKLVVESLEYIDAHSGEMITVTDIAKTLGTSISYLSRIFRETTGETLIGTINRKKTELAKVYLAQTDLKVYQISDMLGFEDVSYFSRFFKKYTGISPKEFQKQCLLRNTKSMI